jgi:hypothetical protein
MFPERAPSEPSRELVHLSAPGIKSHATMGTTGEAGSGMFRQDGLFSGNLFPIIGSNLYSVTKAGVSTQIGDVGNEEGLSRFASIRANLVVLKGSTGIPRIWDGATLQQITDPDIGTAVKDIASIDGRLLLATGDDTFYWSEVLDPDNIDSLSFATAERSPDDIRAILISHQEVWLMGGETIEVFGSTGDSDAPFVPIEGATIERGCATRDAAIVEDNTIFWVGEDRVVYRAEGYRPLAISTPFEEETLRSIDDLDLSLLKMWSYTQDGHKFIVIRTPNNGALVYDVATGGWHTRETRGRSTYRPIDAANWDGRIFALDGKANATVELDAETDDDLGEEIERVLQAYTPVRRNVSAFSFSLDATKGVGTSSVEDPSVMLRFSDDQGRTWGPWKFRSLGKVGEYMSSIQWRALGRMKAPGRIWEIKVSDPVRVAIYGARLNDVGS